MLNFDNRIRSKPAWVVWSWSVLTVCNVWVRFYVVKKMGLIKCALCAERQAESSQSIINSYFTLEESVLAAPWGRELCPTPSIAAHACVRALPPCGSRL